MRATDGGKGFKAKVYPDGWVNGGTRLTVIHGGTRSQVVYLATRKQIELTRDALQAYLDAHPEQETK